MPAPELIDVDPRTFRLPPSRAAGADKRNSRRRAARTMIRRSNIIGRRITTILGESSSDENINFCDFIYKTDSGSCFRMPFDDESGDLLPAISPRSHAPVVWPRGKSWHYRWTLWTAQIADVLVPVNADERFPDAGAIALTSGSYLVQRSSGPAGIAPCVNIISRLVGAVPLISVWSIRS